jgi:hypothetical protein
MVAIQKNEGNKHKIWCKWTINPTTFGPMLLIIENTGKDEDLVNFNNLIAIELSLPIISTRMIMSNDFEFSSNFIKNFNDKGHKLTMTDHLLKAMTRDSFIKG